MGTRIVLTFGEVDLEIRFESTESGTNIALTQKHIPLLDEGKVVYHIKQHDFLLESLFRLRANAETSP